MMLNFRKNFGKLNVEILSPKQSGEFWGNAHVLTVHHSDATSV